MSKILGIVFLSFLITSCSYFKSSEPSDAVVTLNDYTLTKNEIDALLPGDVTPQDSTKIVEAFINQWAIDRLIFERSIDNISKDEQLKLDELVEKYRIELYSQTYLQDLAQQKLDTTLTASKIKKYYEANKNQFRLSEDLIKFKAIQLTKSLNDVAAAERLFRSTNPESQRTLDSLSVNFKSSFLNDSVWNLKKNLLERVGSITPANEYNILVPNKYSKLEDSVSVYLVHVKEFLKRGDVAPLEYIKPTVREILINKRKLLYLKKIQKEILDDAISSDKLKIKK